LYGGIESIPPFHFFVLSQQMKIQLFDYHELSRQEIHDFLSGFNEAD